MTAPSAFISYSHDSPTHREWVLQLATRLRQSGVDAILDMWALQPGDDLPAFMERNLVAANRVLMICTEKYVEKANAGAGGVGYEKMIATADLMRSIDSNKVIPLIRQTGARRVPTFLSSKLYLDFSREELFEFSFDELIRTLHNAPVYVKPALGGRPTFESPPPATKAGDPILAIMRAYIKLYDARPSSSYVYYSTLAVSAQKEGISRIYLDALLKDMMSEDLLAVSHGEIHITDRGREYAIENGVA
jgi:hypothetical protein